MLLHNTGVWLLVLRDFWNCTAKYFDEHCSENCDAGRPMVFALQTESASAAMTFWSTPRSPTWTLSRHGECQILTSFLVKVKKSCGCQNWEPKVAPSFCWSTQLGGRHGCIPAGHWRQPLRPVWELSVAPNFCHGLAPIFAQAVAPKRGPAHQGGLQ